MTDDTLPKTPATQRIDVAHLARLARLDLSDTEQTTALSDLGRIIDMIDLMNSVDTDGVIPMSNPLDAQARLRTDEVTEHVEREHFQAGAPSVEDGFYLVPRVVE